MVLDILLESFVVFLVSWWCFSQMNDKLNGGSSRVSDSVLHKLPMLIFMFDKNFSQLKINKRKQ